MSKEAYLERLNAQFDEWNVELHKLEAQTREAKADMKIKYEDELRMLRLRRDEARRKLDEIKAANSEAWEQLKQGAEDSWNRLKEAMASAKSQFH